MCRRGSTTSSAARSTLGARATCPPSNFLQFCAPGVSPQTRARTATRRPRKSPGQIRLRARCSQGLSRATSEAIHPPYSIFVRAPLPFAPVPGLVCCRRCLGWWHLAATAALLQLSWRRIFGMRAGRAAAAMRVRMRACVERTFFVLASCQSSFCASMSVAVWRYFSTINKFAV